MGWMVIGHEAYHSLNFRLKKNGSLVGGAYIFSTSLHGDISGVVEHEQQQFNDRVLVS
jgi:hypothetical protein